jgi:hypothetical protein
MGLSLNELIVLQTRFTGFVKQTHCFMGSLMALLTALLTALLMALLTAPLMAIIIVT